MFLAAILNGAALSQCQSYETSFEATGCPTSPCPHIDDGNCLPGWATSHGRSHLSTDAALTGNRSLRLDFDYSPTVEQGAFLVFPFEANKTYLLTFSVAVGGFVTDDNEVGRLIASLTNNVTFSNACDNDNTPGITAYEVFDETYSANSAGIGGWGQECVVFTPAFNFSQLWLRTETVSNPSDDHGARLYIDDLAIQQYKPDFEVDQAADGCFCLLFTSECEEGVHQWDFGDGSQVSSEVNPVHCFPDEGPFNVKHTVTLPCDNSTVETTVSVEPGNEFDHVLGSLSPFGNSLQVAIDNDPTLANFFGNTTIDKQILIQGELDIDVLDNEHIFWDCTIVMDAGAGINVKTGKSLGIVNSTIRGCENRWRSIEVEQGAELNLYNNKVSDGQYAIDLQSFSELLCQENTFDRNFVAIHSGPLTGAINQNGGLSGNQFLCTGQLLPHFDGNDPNDGTISYAGIELNDIENFFIGAGSDLDDVNLFMGLRNGILGFNAGLSVVNTRFQDIELDNQYAINGNGIYMVYTSVGGNTLFQRGLGQGGPWSFSNCRRGIFTDGVSIQMQFNNMVNMYMGVEVKNALDQIKIISNDIEASSKGIVVNNSLPASNIDILNNALDMTGPKATGIEFNQAGLPPNPGYSHNLTGNSIRLNDFSSTGIRCNASRETFLGNNEVYALTGASNFTGFRLSGCLDNYLQCNTASGYSAGTGKGFVAWDAENTTWRCNSASDSHTGVSVNMGGAGENNFVGTTFSNHHFGLLIEDGNGVNPGILGPQSHTGNRWLGSYSGAGARHESDDPLVVNESKFTIHTSTTPYHPTVSVVSPVMQTDFFLTNSGTPNSSCQSPSACPQDEIATEDAEIKSLDESIAGGALDSVGAEQRWLAERYLYRKLSRHPELVEAETAIDTFFTEKTGETVGLFHAIETDIRELFLLSPTDSAALTDNFAAIDGKMQAVVVIDSLLLLATGQDSLDLLQQRLDAAQFIDSIGLEQDSLLADIQAQRTSASTQVISDNAAITCTEVFEENEQDVNEIFLKTIAQGIFTFDSTQVPMLEDIAFQCPLTGGRAVFRARGLLALVGDYEYDDETVCDSLIERSSIADSRLENSETAMLTLFPNPSNGTVQVEFARDPIGGRFALLDIYGKVFMENQFLKTTKISFDTDQLPVGTYICRIHFDDREAATIKIAVIR